jgi:amidase
MRRWRCCGRRAVLVPVEKPKLEGLGEAEHAVLMTELKADLNAYLAGAAPGVTVRSLADVIAFDDKESARNALASGRRFP